MSKINTSILILITLTCISNVGFTQTSTDTIHWQTDYKLKWEDFKGKPDTPSKYGAVSNPIIRYFLSANKDSFAVKVFCFFIKSKSWSIFKNNDTLLMHEQGHFDIAELFARKLRKVFAEYKFNYRTIGKDIENLFRFNKQERIKMDTLYDKETDLSRNGKQQLLWNKKIKDELDNLKNYATLGWGY
jgi:hypothetical protein